MTATAWRVFDVMFQPYLRRRFAHVLVRTRARLPRDVPVMLIANHVSWWDGFFLREVQRQLLPGLPMFTVMLDNELARFPFLRALGALPIDPQQPMSVLRLVRALQRRRRFDPGMAVSFFPQGRIRPSWQRPLDFRRGVTVLADALAPCAIVPVGIHIEPLTRAAPSAFLSVGEPRVVEARPALDMIEGAVTQELDNVMTWIAEHGEHAADDFSVRVGA
jgi:1-acyl-sn-glycerol-3-phosphate acyltransferase